MKIFILILICLIPFILIGILISLPFIEKRYLKKLYAKLSREDKQRWDELSKEIHITISQYNESKEKLDKLNSLGYKLRKELKNKYKNLNNYEKI